MRGTGKVFWLPACAVSMVFGLAVAVLGGQPTTSINISQASGYVLDDDNDAPDVTARVARISFIRGDAKIKRAGAADWENLTLNLPVVEGDEIATDAGARVEIQFDNYQHLRLAENSFLKVATLRDDGIAVSISLGTMNARITEFDKDRSFFEVDAPKTTLAVQKTGSYRIDAGRSGDSEIRLTVAEGGEARVYSETAGFTLKNNRSARVFIDGDNAGEWEPADASRFTDEFDTWALDRDSTIERRLAGAYYDKYYDHDIYGADDLNGYGDWVYSNQYGYAWRPYSSAINLYADWSPYRYGHWRWISPYGWVWINDEPWGWATYHHGRWFYDNGFWYWSPYGYYRYTRSWWFPALVVMNVFNNNVCWYPLPYHCHYYNYNWHNSHHGGHHNVQPPVTGGIKPIPPALNTSPDPYTPAPNTSHDPATAGIKVPPVTTVPTKAVVAISTAAFGTTVKTGHTPPLSVANAFTAKPPTDIDPPQLPAYSAVSGKVGSDIIRQRPKTDVIAAQTKVGAATRQEGEPLDKELRTTRVFGGRQPVTTGDQGGVKAVNKGDTRPTGAVTRPPSVKQDADPIRQAPVYLPPPQTEPTIKAPSVRQPKQLQYDPPVKLSTPRYDPPVRQPTYSPPQDPPTVKSPPRSDPPTKSEPKPSPTSKPADSGGSKKVSSKSD